MHFGIVGSYCQPLITEGQALEELCLAGYVWEACTHFPVSGLHLLVQFLSCK